MHRIFGLTHLTRDARYRPGKTAERCQANVLPPVCG
jgi:hypothetical protein